MRSCRECGGGVQDEFRFCPHCGKAQRTKIVEYFQGHPGRGRRRAARLRLPDRAAARAPQRLARRRGAGRDLARPARAGRLGPLPPRGGPAPGTRAWSRGSSRGSRLSAMTLELATAGESHGPRSSRSSRACPQGSCSTGRRSTPTSAAASRATAARRASRSRRTRSRCSRASATAARSARRSRSSSATATTRTGRGG